jgi:hypothetical protein
MTQRDDDRDERIEMDIIVDAYTKTNLRGLYRG